MNEKSTYIIEKLINDQHYTIDSFYENLKNNPYQFKEIKQILQDDDQKDHHEFVISYICKQVREHRHEIFEEFCKIYRTPFLTHRTSLSRVLIVNQEVFLHIIKNDKRFFKDGPERTSVNVIEEYLQGYLGTFYPTYFSKENNVRIKEIYDALRILEDESDPALITTTRLKPGTGTGKRRRKRYCLTEEGFDEIIPILSIVIRDELENLRYQI